MSYQIEIRTLQPQPILGIREATTHAEISSTLAKILPEVFGYAMQSGAQLAGPPLSIYHEWNPPHIVLEGAVPLAQPALGNNRVHAGMLPGGPAAVTVHMGPYDKLELAYNALQAWMKENGKQPAGAPWEVYWTDPGQVPNPAEWKTEVFWPIA